jgi:Tol biopolymer transport system component
MRAWLVMAAVFVAFSGAAVPACADSLVLVTSSRSGNPDLFLIDVEWGDTFNVTRHASFDAYPTWSRDGKKIAFASARDGQFHIYTIDADGQNLAQLTSGETIDRVPSFSPDGRQIAFCRRPVNESITSIYVMDSNGGNEKLVRENGFDPDWSPDGKKIVYTAPREGQGFRLYVMHVDGTNDKDLTTTDNSIGFVYPAWSPDGRQIAFTELVGNDLEVHVIDAQGENLRQLTTLKGVNSYAAWSPDGKQISFQHHDQNRIPGPVYLMDADGANQKVISVLRSERFVEGGRHAWRPR